MHDPRRVNRGDRAHQLVGHRRERLDRDAPAVAFLDLLEGLAVEQLENEVSAPILGLPIVTERDDGAMLDRVRDARFPEEPLDHRRIGAERRMEDLQGRAMAVAVCRGVHRGGGAPAEQAVDAPSPIDHSALSLFVALTVPDQDAARPLARSLLHEGFHGRKNVIFPYFELL